MDNIKVTSLFRSNPNKTTRAFVKYLLESFHSVVDEDHNSFEYAKKRTLAYIKHNGSDPLRDDTYVSVYEHTKQFLFNKACTIYGNSLCGFKLSNLRKEGDEIVVNIEPCKTHRL